jgi:plasmid replication initiation protein
MSQLTLNLDSPLTGHAKNDRNLMVFNFFSLCREKVTELPVYDDGVVRIEVVGTKYGVATIWDKELLIYVASLMQEKMNRGEFIDPDRREFRFTAHDLFRITGTKPGGSAYERIRDGLQRLQGTQVITNLETGGEGEERAFSWIDTYDIKYRRTRGGEKTMEAVSVTLCKWLFRAILKDRRMLTYDTRYFALPPIEKRLYEIARAHCGRQGGFRMGIEKLRLRVGSDNDLRRFKAQLVAISKRKHQLPGYGLMVVDPRASRLPDKRVPPPPGRTPLKSFMVFFFSIERMATMPTFDQAPVVDDGDLPPSSDL